MKKMSSCRLQVADLLKVEEREEEDESMKKMRRKKKYVGKRVGERKESGREKRERASEKKIKK
jgi:hypothetical protein